MPDHQPLTEHTQQVWILLQQTYLLTLRYFESVTHRFGLSYPQTAVLAVLRTRGRPLPLSHVARLLTQEAQSTTELADRLEKKGYVQRVRDQRDRRLVLLELTERGREVIDQILPALRDASREVLGDEDWHTLQQLPELLLPIRNRAAARLGIKSDRLQPVEDLSDGRR